MLVALPFGFVQRRTGTHVLYIVACLCVFQYFIYKIYIDIIIYEEAKGMMLMPVVCRRDASTHWFLHFEYVRQCKHTHSYYILHCKVKWCLLTIGLFRSILVKSFICRSATYIRAILFANLRFCSCCVAGRARTSLRLFVLSGITDKPGSAQI